MKILGVSAHGPDAAAALIEDGEVIAAAREESFTRSRRDDGFPLRAIRFCLAQGRIAPHELDMVAYPEKALRKFERVLATELRRFPRGAPAFAREMFRWLGGRLWTKNELMAEVGVDASKIRFVERHVALAAVGVRSARLRCETGPLAVLSADAEGEWATAAILTDDTDGLRVSREIHHPHALSRLSAALAAHLAFDGTDGASRFLALAGHGRSTGGDRDEAVRSLMTVREDGSFVLDLETLGQTGEPGAPIAKALLDRIGPARHAGTPLRWRPDDSHDADLAHAAALSIGDATRALAEAAMKEVGSRHLVLAGDLVESPAMTARLIASGVADQVSLAPLGGGAGAAIGAALAVASVEDEGAAGLSTAITTDIGPFAREGGAECVGALADTMAETLVSGKLVAWVRGRLDVTAHSLGGRSLLSSPVPVDAAKRVNRDVKRREEWLPHGSMILAEEASDWIAPPVELADRRLASRQLAVPVFEAQRSRIPAVVHGDGTALMRIVHAGEDPAAHALLRAFHARTGVPVLLETTLRLSGEPMVKDEVGARRLMERSAISMLVVDDERILLSNDDDAAGDGADFEDAQGGVADGAEERRRGPEEETAEEAGS